MVFCPKPWSIYYRTSAQIIFFYLLSIESGAGGVKPHAIAIDHVLRRNRNFLILDTKQLSEYSPPFNVGTKRRSPGGGSER